MIEFKLPALGADMDEAPLLEWSVQPGDVVKKGQVVAVVDTTKAAVDVECWQEGTVAELLIQPGEKIPVGTPLATLLEAGEKTAPKKAGGTTVSTTISSDWLRSPKPPAFGLLGSTIWTRAERKWLPSVSANGVATPLTMRSRSKSNS